MRKEYSKYFEKALRHDGVHFIKRRADAPDDLAELIREIHLEYFGGALPNDWIYSTILEAFEDLEREEIDDLNLECDPYYSDLYKWFGEPFAHELCEEAQEEEVCAGAKVYEIIGTAQWLAKDRIYRAVNDFIQGEVSCCDADS